jgi:hypothetical protein
MIMIITIMIKTMTDDDVCGGGGDDCQAVKNTYMMEIQNRTS